MPHIGDDWRDWCSRHTCHRCQSFTAPAFLYCPHGPMEFELQSLGNSWYECAFYTRGNIIALYELRIDGGYIWEVVDRMLPSRFERRGPSATAA